MTILLTLKARPQAVAMSVGLYITAAYWFTASTSFANPAVTIARSFSNTFAGIRLHDVPLFIGAQFIGAVCAMWVSRWLLHGQRGNNSSINGRNRCRRGSEQFMKFGSDGGPSDLPSVAAAHFESSSLDRLEVAEPSTHKPRILLLYGSLRERSFSRFLTEEAARLLAALGADTRISTRGTCRLPTARRIHIPKFRNSLSRGLVGRTGLVLTRRHGAMSGIMKAQIDWIPLSLGAVRPTQGKTLAVMQVCGGSQSFNAVNQMRVLGRWMRMFTIPNQSSVAERFRNSTMTVA